MSLIGKKIEFFNGNAYNPQTEEFITVDVSDLQKGWSVVIFYPADFSFVCPTELEDMQKIYGELQELGVEVYSVSTDTHFVHKAWHDHSDKISSIEYTMVGDPTWQIAREFDVLDEEAGLAQRGTFVIDPDGVVQTVEINADGIGREAAYTLDKVKAAQYVRENPGEVCPADWKESGDTLTPGLDLVGKI